MGVQQAYINGFVKRANEYGVSSSDAIDLLKTAGLWDSLKARFKSPSLYDAGKVNPLKVHLGESAPVVKVPGPYYPEVSHTNTINNKIDNMVNNFNSRGQMNRTYKAFGFPESYPLDQDAGTYLGNQNLINSLR